MPHRVIPDREQRAARAVTLRLDGQPYRLIGQQLDVHPMTVWHWVHRHIGDGGPHAEQLRAVELSRLDRQLEHLAGRRAELVRQHPSAIGAAP